jgi:hypothetical protein
MSQLSSRHLTEEQLARYQDGQAQPSEIQHLDACGECTDRLADLEASVEAYRAFLVSIESSALQAPPQPWRPLNSLIAQHETSRSRQRWQLWLIPLFGTAICVALLIGIMLRRPSQEPTLPAAEELLSRSARAQLPNHRMVSMRLHGQSLIRPAVLSTSAEDNPELAHLANLFTEARYNWQEPLSARSFQSWRSGLRDKRDSVTIIRARGAENAYRIRTDTSSGVLRSSALTLRVKDLHPTQGTFQFEGEEPLEIDEFEPTPPRETFRPAPPATEPEPVPAETPASPADALHVLAALNEIGADVGEPIEISEDANRQVLVRAMGLSPDRLHQIAAAIWPLSHTNPSIDTDVNASGATIPLRPQTVTAAVSSSGMPAALRQRFEDRLGGPAALQEMTDRVLETSALVIARAHAIEVLATKFPPQIESGLAVNDQQLLVHLRQIHVAALSDLTARLQTDLRPLLTSASATEKPPSLRWQERAPDLLSTAQRLDDALNRLLAGSYSDAEGETLLNSLGGQLARLRQDVELQNEHAR